jgi:hypothetical protein
MGVKKILGEPGTLSHGTMRDVDLIPAFLEELERLDPAQHYEKLKEWIPLAWETFEEEADRWESLSNFTINLFEVLEYYAPDGHYFGAHPGDGSDYGFWPEELESESEEE